MVERFFDDMEYFHLRLEHLQTSVMGDIGLAWGRIYHDPHNGRTRLASGALPSRHSALWRRGALSEVTHGCRAGSVTSSAGCGDWGSIFSSPATGNGMWRATFWVTGTTPPALGGSAYEKTAWGAVQRAAWDAISR